MKLILAGIVAALATPAIADDFPVRLKDGATWTITAVHSRAAPGMGPIGNWSLTTVKRLTWRAGAAGKAATLRVDPVSATPGPDSPKEVASGRSLAIPATLGVDDDLTPREIVNRDEVRTEFKRLVPNAANARDEIIDASTKAMIAAELGVVSRVQGLSLAAGKPVSGPIEIANPLGRDPLQGVESATLVAHDKASGKATIRWRQSLDPTSFKAFLDKVLTALSTASLPPDRIAEMRTALAGAAYEVETLCDIELDTRSGLATRAECLTKQDITTLGKTQHIDERWLVTQTLPDNS